MRYSCWSQHGRGPRPSYEQCSQFAGGGWLVSYKMVGSEQTDPPVLDPTMCWKIRPRTGDYDVPHIYYQECTSPHIGSDICFAKSWPPLRHFAERTGAIWGEHTANIIWLGCLATRDVACIHGNIRCGRLFSLQLTCKCKILQMVKSASQMTRKSHALIGRCFNASHSNPLAISCIDHTNGWTAMVSDV